MDSSTRSSVKVVVVGVVGCERFCTRGILGILGLIFECPRVRFSGLGPDSREAADNIMSQRRLPSQKTQSFIKGERTAELVQEAVLRQMDEGNYFNDSIEFAAVIAAAAFAVNSLEDAELQGRKQSTDRSEASLIRIKSRKDQEQGEASVRNLEMTEEDAAIKHRPPEKAVVRTPTISKPSSTDNYSTTIGPKLKPAAAPASYKYPRDNGSEKARNSRSYGETDAIADIWEKSAMERIKKKETEKRGERAFQHYRSEISWIEQIVAGARAEADEKRRYEGFKIKETENKIRVTEKVPVKCFCF
ncbi:hypothetical protein Syun_001266 [Stephania yunnanensis]|uniref:Remorin C-terminal domain-containing protein n=1 Tax=Stephania yunnanensis TaxID=152371 RepID=A0AAP0LDS3_9MAGN